MVNGGNEAARAKWLARYNKEITPVDPNSDKSIESFIRRAYEKKEWVKKEHSSNDDDDEDDKNLHAPPSERRKKRSILSETSL